MTDSALDEYDENVARLAFNLELESMSLATREKRLELFKTFADFAYDWVYWMDPDGRCLYVSPSCERITGHFAAEFMHNPNLIELIAHPLDREAVARHLHQERVTQDLCSFDFRLIARSGEERWIAHVCRPVYGDDGTYLGRSANNHDITDRKQEKQRLIESERLYRALVEAAERMEEGIAILQDQEEHEAAFVFTNEEFARMVAFSVQELSGMRLGELLSSGHRPLAMNQYRRTQAGRDTERRHETLLMQKTGGTVPIELSFSQTTFGGRPATVCFARDITDRKRAEETRETLIAELQFALSKVKTLSGMLPICSTCKKVRNDNGYWSQIEEFIRDHSNAEFSHSICPECVDKLYPDMFEK